MNNILPAPINEKKITKILALALLLFCLIPIVLNICCLTPLYFNLENNTIYRGTAITVTLKYIADLLDLVAFGSVYAILIFSLLLFKKKITTVVCISYIALLILKVPARLLMNIPLYGTIGTKEELIADLISLSFYLILELLQFILVFIFTSICSSNYLHSLSILSKKSSSTHQIENILPIKKYFYWYNPLLRCAVYSSITVTVFKFIARLITDIDAGAPDSFGEVMIIILNYLTDAAYGFAAYILAILIFNLLYEKLTKVNKTDNKDDKYNNNNKNKKENKADKDEPSALFED